MNEQELTHAFAKLGARDPAAWARSQLQDVIPQLARFLFLRQAWGQIVADGDETWLINQMDVDPLIPGG